MSLDDTAVPIVAPPRPPELETPPSLARRIIAWAGLAFLGAFSTYFIYTHQDPNVEALENWPRALMLIPVTAAWLYLIVKGVRFFGRSQGVKVFAIHVALFGPVVFFYLITVINQTYDASPGTSEIYVVKGFHSGRNGSYMISARVDSNIEQDFSSLGAAWASTSAIVGDTFCVQTHPGSLWTRWATNGCPNYQSDTEKRARLASPS